MPAPLLLSMRIFVYVLCETLFTRCTSCAIIYLINIFFRTGRGVRGSLSQWGYMY